MIILVKKQGLCIGMAWLPFQKKFNAQNRFLPANDLRSSLWKYTTLIADIINFLTVLVYADSSDSCNTLDFQLGNNGLGTTIASRSWNIKVESFFYSIQ